MKKLAVFWCVLALFIGMFTYAEATVLTFDELSGDGYPLANYGGFNWGYNFLYLNGDTYGGGGGSTGYTLGVVSHSNIAYNGFYADVDVTNSTPFTFNGAYFTSAWDETLNIGIKGYLGAAELFSTIVVANNDGPVWAALNWTGIDKLTFTSSGGNQFVMDNFTYNANAVPLPGALMLLGPGLAGLALFRRWLQK